MSGNREFGIRENPDCSFTFYTAGVDRTTTLADAEANHWANAVFSGADALWNSLVAKTEQYLDQNGGNSTGNDPVIARPNWDNAKSILK